jgi:hypothetical protein
VQRSQGWRWSSLKPTEHNGPHGLLVDGPVAKPDSLTRFVNGVATESELKSVRQCPRTGCLVRASLIPGIAGASRVADPFLSEA